MTAYPAPGSDGGIEDDAEPNTKLQQVATHPAHRKQRKFRGQRNTEGQDMLDAGDAAARGLDSGS